MPVLDASAGEKVRSKEMSQKRMKTMRVCDIKMEPGAEEMAASENMKPYIRAHAAIMKNQHAAPEENAAKDAIHDRLRAALEEIAGLPLADRYIWRIASALKWAFADFDSSTVALDRDLMPDVQREEIDELLRTRPTQLALMLNALYGEEKMERAMLEAVANATAK